MKIRSKQILTLYFNSWWFPAVFFLAEFAVFTMVVVLQWRPLFIVERVLLVCCGIAFLGILSASLWNLMKKRWAKAVVNLVMLPVCGVPTYHFFFLLIGFTTGIYD